MPGLFVRSWGGEKGKTYEDKYGVDGGEIRGMRGVSVNEIK